MQASQVDTYFFTYNNSNNNHIVIVFMSIQIREQITKYAKIKIK